MEQRPPRAQPPRNQSQQYLNSPNTAPTSPTGRRDFNAKRDSSSAVRFDDHQYNQGYSTGYDASAGKPVYSMMSVNSVGSPLTPNDPYAHVAPTLGHGYTAADEAAIGGGAGAYGDSNFRRKKSLVRPDRERIDPNHRLYHYRNHAAQLEEEGHNGMSYMPSSTGNYPQREGLRRGKSLLNRDQDVQESGVNFLRGRATNRRKRASTASAGVASANQSEVVKKDPYFCLRSTPGPHDPWMLYCWLLTCCIPPFLLSACGMRTPEQQRAWREKIGLVGIITTLMAAVGFLTFGFTQAVCGTPPQRYQTGHIDRGYLIVHGFAYELSKWKHPAVSGYFSGNSNPLFEDYNAGGMDASFLFQRVNMHCKGYIGLANDSSIKTDSTGGLNWYFPCNLHDQFGESGVNLTGYDSSLMCHADNTARNRFAALDKSAQVYYTWEDLSNPKRNLAVYESSVLDLDLLGWLSPGQVTVPSMFSEFKNKNGTFNGQDITMFMYRNKLKDIGACLQDIVTVGFIDTRTFGCVASDVVLYVSLVFIIGVVAIKFGMAVIFGWFLSWRLGTFGDETYGQRMQRAAEIEAWTDNIYSAAPRHYRPSVNPEKAANRKTMFLPTTSRFSKVDMLASKGGNRPATVYAAPEPAFKKGNRPQSFGSAKSYLAADPNPAFQSSQSSTSFHDNVSMDRHSNSDPSLAQCPFPLVNVIPQPPPDYEPNNFPLAHTICLVTAYSESIEGLRTTLDSLATTDYANSHKLILVIADGMVKGSGNALTTPEIVLGMMKEFVIPPEEVMAHSYVAIADGHKRHNMAKVYAGFYLYDDNTVEASKQQRVPIVLVSKVGNPLEVNDAKPGNRGKRDSQIVLMAFLQKVMFDERMTTFEYEFFNSIWRVTGIRPDRYEIVLCVDADTKIFPDSLTRMVACMVNDEEIMGLCGETKIANKAETWVTMIQVFEYYISHHLTKAFESMFGGVTCLPGCFSMYRIKAPKGGSGYWVPILANPDIVEHYSENIVDSLHKKNLLLLGEDRYLSTLMLKTFPKRKMIFVPQAVCKTIVPDTFSVLLSQRRRWINSTVHNLAELLLVRDLCGTFCFSMQFVVFMELTGTLVLPAAISFTVYLIIVSIVPSSMPTPVIPLILLGIILGLPGLLIVLTSRKVAYVGWMLIYLLSLPIWNFVLPAYAYWHFDDFSWGQTRQVSGEKATGAGHGDKEGEFDSSHIVMKRWVEFERERRFKSGTHSRDSTYYDVVHRTGSPKRYSMISTSEASDMYQRQPMTYQQVSSPISHESSLDFHSRSRGDLMLPAPLSVGQRPFGQRDSSPASSIGRPTRPGGTDEDHTYNPDGNSAHRLLPSPGDYSNTTRVSASDLDDMALTASPADYAPPSNVGFDRSTASPFARPQSAQAQIYTYEPQPPPPPPHTTAYVHDLGEDESSQVSHRRAARGVSLVDPGPVPSGQDAGRRVPRPSARRSSAQVPGQQSSIQNQNQPRGRPASGAGSTPLPPGASMSPSSTSQNLNYRYS